MWILHPKGGFLSAVQHNDDAGLLVVRARIQADLFSLAGRTGKQITGSDYADYPWRIIVTNNEFAHYMADLVAMIDYGNFKANVEEVQGKPRASIYSRVWHTLLGLERLDPAASELNRRTY